MRVAGQTAGIPAAINREVIGVCIECAVRHHHFRQGTSGEGGKDWFEAAIYEAWIDGRVHTLLPSVGTTAIIRCRECFRETTSLYMPSE